jgi:outer membrane protein OmpA-like peptidoglycan-associated protein
MKLKKGLLIDLILISIFCCILNNDIYAQDGLLNSTSNTRNQYGIFTHFNYNNHFVDFSKFEGYPLCCTNFDYGLGLGLNIGLLADFPISSLPFDLQFRIGYNQLSGKFEEIEPKVFGINGVPVNGNITYTINTNISSLDFGTYAKREIAKNLNVFAGIKLGYINQSKFEQKEQISHGVFVDTKSNIRNPHTGQIPNFSTILTFLSIGSSYNINLFGSQSWLLSPELFLDLGLQNLVKDSSWFLLSPKVGISLAYRLKAPEREKIEYEHKEFIDTIEIINPLLTENKFRTGIPVITIDSSFSRSENKKVITESLIRIDTLFLYKDYILKASVRAVGVDEGIEKDIITMEIKEYQYFSMRPLLNYIFFDENSAKIHDRYVLINKKEALNFNVNQIYDLKTLDTYYYILNIIGFRLRNNPKANITIVGCNSNSGLEQNNMTLSLERATAVMNYFINTWEISADRIKIKNRNLPEKPSPMEYPEGLEENRRVEIYSDNYEIIAPLFINDTLRTTTPSDIRFYPEIYAEAGLKNWTIQAEQNNIIYKEFFGQNKLPNYLEWSIDLEKNSIPVFNQPLIYYIEAMDSVNNNIVSQIDSIDLQQIKIEKTKNRVGDKKIEHFSLILFDFDDTSLNETNIKIKDYIKSKVAQNSKVIIAGYTDKLGEETYNQKLSLNRAISLAKLLNLPLNITKGLGESVLLYDNSLPEGRFYCRTVEVIVETPLLLNQED